MPGGGTNWNGKPGVLGVLAAGPAPLAAVHVDVFSLGLGLSPGVHAPPWETGAATAAGTSDPPSPHTPHSGVETVVCSSWVGTAGTAMCMSVATVEEVPAGSSTSPLKRTCVGGLLIPYLLGGNRL